MSPHRLRTGSLGLGLLVAALGSAALPARAQDPAAAPAARAGTPAGAELSLVIGRWCPFVCADQPELKGFVTEIALAILEPQGFRVSLIDAPYTRAIETVRSGRADAIILTGEDAPDLIYPELEQGVTRIAFFVRADNPWRYTDPESLEPLRRVGIMQAYDYLELAPVIARDAEKFDRMGGDEPIPRSLRKLLAGRLDALICDNVVTQYELRKLGKAAEVIEAGALPHASSVYVGFSPQSARSPQLAELMTRGTRELRASGELAKILARYGMIDWHAPLAGDEGRVAPAAGVPPRSR